MAKEKYQEDILWKDRKRILGMPISFTRYEVTDDRFIMRKGLFRTETNELLLYRILDIKLVRTFGQKLFGVGTITLYSADKSHGTLEITNVKKSDEVRRFLSQIVEKVRNEKGVTGREIYGAAAGIMRDVDGDGIPELVDTDGDGFPG